MLYLGLLVPTFGQELRFKNLTIKDGFVHNGTSHRNTIIKDQEGFVWFTTFGGLSRFDGVNFKNYRTSYQDSSTLSTNILGALGVDYTGNIWVSTFGGGINILDTRQDLFSIFSTGNEALDKKLRSNTYFIESDSENNIWLGADDKLIVWNVKKDSIHLQADLRPRSCIKDSDGSMWISSEQSIYKHVKESNKLEKINVVDSNSNDWVIDFIEIESEVLLILTHLGKLYQFNTNTKEQTDVGKKVYANIGFKPVALHKGNNQSIWLLNASNLDKYDWRENTSKQYRHDPDDPLSIPKPPIQDLLIDEDGVLFLNTGDNGMSYAQTDISPFETVGEFDAMEFIMINNQELLIRDFNLGPIIYNTKTTNISKSEIPMSNGTWYRPTMEVDKDSILWIWDHDQISSYNLISKEFRLAPKNPTHSLYIDIDKKGRVWNGLSYLNQDQEKWVNVLPDMKSAIPTMSNINFSYANYAFDESNRIWANIQGHIALICYDIEQKTGFELPNIGMPKREVNNRILCVGPYGLGVIHAENDSISIISEKQGLDHSGTFAGGEDRYGNTWIGTPQGLQKYDPSQNICTKYTYEDGFPLDGNALVRHFEFDPAGNVYFDVNMERIVRIHPEKIITNQETGPIHLLHFYLGSKKILPNDSNQILTQNLRFSKKLKLNYKQTDFGFEFIMPVFYKSRDIEYFYKLHPYHKDWISNGTSNEVHFTNIDPDNYTLQIKAQTASGQWSENKASMDISISPPWWKMWWAYVGYALVGFSLLSFLYFSNLRRTIANQEANKLKEIGSLKSKLYTNITHEFRTPLTVILGTADSLKDSHKKNIIRRNSNNLLRLINQLLDLSKLDERKLTLQLVHGDIIHHLRYITESFESMAREKNLSLTFYTEESTLYMDFDEQKIQHIIYNLLSNAIKFTPQNGQIILHVREENDIGKSNIQIKVSDNGIGIEADHVSQIFDRFYQIDSSMTRKAEGTGIGLALTKELVELMGGQIGIKSIVNKGTHVTVQVPIQKNVQTKYSPGELSKQITPIEELVKQEMTGIEKIKENMDLPVVLIVEDNRDVSNYIQELLHDKYQILVAKNGQEGVDMAFQALPDLILSDVMMPIMDGYELCSKIKSDPLTDHIPIILLTAKSLQENRLEGLAYGADAYLIKPFDKSELFIRIEKLIQIRKAMQQKYQDATAPQIDSISNKKDVVEDKFILRIKAVVEEKMSEKDFDLKLVHTTLGVNKMQMYRKVKSITGSTPTLLVRSIRLAKAKELLQTTNKNVSEVAYATGFSDPAYFSRVFKEEFGKTPSEMLK